MFYIKLLYLANVVCAFYVILNIRVTFCYCFYWFGKAEGEGWVKELIYKEPKTSEVQKLSTKVEGANREYRRPRI